MTKWLRKHNFSYKKSRAVPAKADARAQEAFVADYNALKNSIEDEPIYFVDSVHPQHQTKLAYGWIFKGSQKSVATTGRQFRVNMIGGINLDGHKICYEIVDHVNADAIALFLTNLRKKHPNQKAVHVIWDNAGYHRDHRILEYADAIGIQLHNLPPYSPNLNPIERLWKIMHESVTYNQYYETFEEFKSAVIGFIKKIGRKRVG